MKRIATHSLVLFVGIGIGILVTGCASTRIKRLSGTEFVTQAQQMDDVSSFIWTTYIGKSSQRAYLEYGHPAFLGSGARTTVFWVPLSELPNDISEQLKAGNPPWKPWQSAAETKENKVNALDPPSSGQ